MEMLDPTDTVLISFSVFVRIAPWLLLLWAALRGLEGVVCKVGAQEPPVVRSKLPVLGQAVRLFIQGVTYYENLRKHTNFPILTTFYGTQKVYIVNSPELISQINRQGKSIDGSLPFIHVVYGKLLGMHGGDLDRLTQNASIKNSLLYEFRTMEHAALAAGSESAAEIHGNILRELNSTLDKIALHGSETLDLLVWLQRTMTLATARAIFGRDSPFDHSEDLVDCVWDMESGLKPLTMLPYQSITARKTVLARERLVQAFIDDCGHEGQVGLGRGHIALSQEFSKIALRNDLSAEFQARYTLGIFTGFVINSVPAAFWIISLLASNEGLTKRIRSEVQPIVRNTTGSEKMTVKASELRSQCPLLLSTCQEVLRYISSSISNFILKHDVHLDNGMILKKGALIQMAATAIHSNTDVWGASANELDPERFLRRDKVHPSANRVFGGGSAMCPGRHLALDELLTFTAMFVHTFDFGLSSDTPKVPEYQRSAMLSIKKPSSSVLVQVTRRGLC